jgi:hypothetical protein
MQRAVVLACCLTLVATAGIAQMPSHAPVDMAAILGLSEGALPSSMPQNEPLFAASRRTGMEKATCTANCSPDPYVTCSTANPTSSCVAADRNCAAGERGHVTCDGVTKSCATACPLTCTEGALRYVFTGVCCDNGTKEKDQQQCVNNQWVYTGVTICGGPCGPRDPVVQ